MDSNDYHKVCKAVDDIVSSSSEDSVQNVENTMLKGNNKNLENKAAGTSETEMEVDTIEAANKAETENNVVEQFAEPSVDINCEVADKENIVEENEDKETLRKPSFDIINSITLSESSTSQDNTPTSSSDVEAGSLFSDQNKIKRSISKGQINGDSGISMEKFGNSSDEDSSKRQKLSEGSDRDTTSSGTENSELRVEVNFNATEDTEDTEDTKNMSDSEDTTDTDGTDDNDISGWRPPLEEDSDSESQSQSSCLYKEKPKPNWFVIPELLRREIGNNPLFRRRYHGSLHVVEHFERMRKLEEHNGCVNALNFNRKGNLLASGSDDLAVIVWDWAIGKKRHVFDSGHKSNLFQTKWLPFNVEYLMATCARDGEVRLLDVRRGKSRKIATHHEQIHRLAVHADTPHIILSAGEDAEVLSIDIREEKPTSLLFVEEDSAKVRLYSIHSNPLNSNEFCVAGESHLVKVYDRRNPFKPLLNLSPGHLKLHTIGSDEHVTCAVYNYNGTEILASYKDEDIYLFDVASPQPEECLPVHKYQGHRNNATVKGVNFFGPKSEYIVSGSDCGNIFIWDKNTEAIVNWLYGDQQGVVNCLEPHPYVPVLATSGLDFDVKIWVPSSKKPPALENLKRCVKSNEKQRALDTVDFSRVFTRRVLLMFVRSTRAAQNNARRGSSEQDSDDDDDDDDDWDDDWDSFFLG